MRSTTFLDEAATRLAGRDPVRVLYTDMDGTLLGPGGSLLHDADGRPSTRAARALTEASECGLHIVPVSGRQRGLLTESARLLGLRDAIAEAGSVTVRGNSVRYAWGECPTDLAATPHEALVISGALETVLEAFPDDLRPYEPWHRDREGGHLLHGRVDVAVANARLRAAGLRWARLTDNGAADGWPGREVHAYHLLPAGVGKAAAVRDDLAARGLAPEQAAAVGDSEEDATMAAVVGIYFRVANGHDHPGHDAVVTPGAMGDGFAQAVTALIAAAEGAR